MKTFNRLFIDGKWSPSAGKEMIDVVNPANEEILARVPAGVPEDVDRAVAAARKAFDGWAGTPLSSRLEKLGMVHEGLSQRADEIAETISRELGMPLKMSRRIQAGLPVMVTDSYLKLVPDFPFEERVGHSLVVREPVGVVGCITPWNFPLHQVILKVVPALAAGCTVVLKPSEVTPLTAFILAEIIDAAGFPPGVFNLISGVGPLVGEALAVHPEVDMVSFTGSTAAGKRVAELASQSVKRVALELGGKSPAVVLEGADLAKAVRSTVNSCFLNSGQACNAFTRLLVPESIYPEAAKLAVEAAQNFTVGDPFDASVKLGPVVSGIQRERVRQFITKAVKEGADLLLGGPESPAELPSGFFVKPTVFGRVTTKMTIAQKEVFGPVLSILTFKDEEEAVRIANDTSYGLAAAVWCDDAERAMAVARRIQAGQVDINGAPFNILAPFGGFKQSGHGRELGKYGLEEFLETKSIQLVE